MFSLSLNAAPRSFRVLTQTGRISGQNLLPWSPLSCVHLAKALGERRLSTSINKPSKRKFPKSQKSRSPPGRPPGILYTLHPDHLEARKQQTFDFSGRTYPLTRLFYDKHSITWHYTAEDPPKQPTVYVPFPPHTKGFLYYHSSPAEPELSAGLRFRICDSATKFNEGVDLRTPDGNVWGHSVHQIVKYSIQKRLLPILRKDDLIDEALIEDIKKLTMFKATQILYTPSDPFVMDVSLQRTTLTYVTRTKTFKFNVLHTAWFCVQKGKRLYPLSGSVKARLELSDLPEHKELGPTIVVRILGIVKPIRMDPSYYGVAVQIPVPGTLLARTSHGKKSFTTIPINSRAKKADFLEFAKGLRSRPWSNFAELSQILNRKLALNSGLSGER